MNKIPLLIMLCVLIAPFAASLALLDDKHKIADKARGQWLNTAHYIETKDNQNWQIIWREKDCLVECEKWENLLLRVRMALGKNQEKVSVSVNQLEPLNAMNDGLFIANHKGLVLLSYEATNDGAYKLLKDLKVLLKHNSQ